eukprot:1222894-Pleurochrysis_carterae.AAC.1
MCRARLVEDVASRRRLARRPVEPFLLRQTAKNSNSLARAAQGYLAPNLNALQPCRPRQSSKQSAPVHTALEAQCHPPVRAEAASHATCSAI